jgi:hypothetical protein
MRKFRVLGLATMLALGMVVIASEECAVAQITCPTGVNCRWHKCPKGRHEDGKGHCVKDR